MAYVVLLPPSEGKSASVGRGKSFAEACPDLAAEVAPVLKHIKRLPAVERVAFYGVSTREKAAAAHALNQVALTSPGIPAIERYTGVVYDFLDRATLHNPAHALAHVLVLSGLYGLIPADAPIADYKLPLNGWLTRHWKSRNAVRLAHFAAGRPILSLLPGAHTKALGVSGVLGIDFKLAGGKKSAGHFGKAIKGKFARYLLEGKVGDLAGVAKFSEVHDLAQQDQ